MEFLVILLLLLLNGVFSMSEAAVIAARHARLQQQADKGGKGAQLALRLAQEPNRFLSTVQVGMTLVGILLGAFGGAAIADQVAVLLRPTPLGRYADAMGFVLVVAVTTYLSLIIGELVPKRLALRSPERIAALIAPLMQTLSKWAAPLVWFLTASTNLVLALLGAREMDAPPVTEEEIKTMMQQGIEAGVFDEGEEEMVSGVFRLGDRRAGAIMTPRTEVYWINLRDPEEEIRAKIKASRFSRLPVCDGDIDHVVGLLNAKRLLSRLLAGEPFSIEAAMVEPQFVPESLLAVNLLDIFRKSAQHIAIVIGEYGGMEGLVTMQDILEEIVGEIETDAPQAVRRPDGSWLIDGLMALDTFMDLFSLDVVPQVDYTTLGGFVMAQRGDIPAVGDTFDWQHLHFEVVDMDGYRVDKVLVTENPPGAETEAPNEETPGEI